ncbi:MAG: hypothetical protein M3271_04805 [Actinomycetota bacterium]|nr:hypothetical protein [Actinomycetota bacterium]
MHPDILGELAKSKIQELHAAAARARAAGALEDASDVRRASRVWTAFGLRRLRSKPA